MDEQLGMEVTVTLVAEGTVHVVVYHNVTELHYNYSSPDQSRVAFESNIHHTGATCPIDCIKEFEVTPSVVLADEF